MWWRWWPYYVVKVACADIAEHATAAGDIAERHDDIAEADSSNSSISSPLMLGCYSAAIH